MAAGRQKAYVWYGRENSCGSCPPASPALPALKTNFRMGEIV